MKVSIELWRLRPHELLSKQVKDDVALRQTLEAVMYNFRHLFQGAQPIEMMMDVDPAIMVSSEQMVTISLVVNELLQNILITHLSHKQVALLNLVEH